MCNENREVIREVIMCSVLYCWLVISLWYSIKHYLYILLLLNYS